MSGNDLIAFNVVDTLIESQKEDIYLSIRKWRNNIIKVTTEMQDCLTMSDLVKLNKFKSFLDAVDYALDNEMGLE